MSLLTDRVCIVFLFAVCILRVTSFRVVCPDFHAPADVLLLIDQLKNSQQQILQSASQQSVQQSKQLLVRFSVFFFFIVILLRVGFCLFVYLFAAAIFLCVSLSPVFSFLVCLVIDGLCPFVLACWLFFLSLLSYCCVRPSWSASRLRSRPSKDCWKEHNNKSMTWKSWSVCLYVYEQARLRQSDRRKEKRREHIFVACSSRHQLLCISLCSSVVVMPTCSPPKLFISSDLLLPGLLQ